MSNFMAFLLGLGVFLVIVAVLWRSVQNKRILRLKAADGSETVIVASEDDEVTNIEQTATHTDPEPTPAIVAVPVAVPVERVEGETKL